MTLVISIDQEPPNAAVTPVTAAFRLDRLTNYRVRKLSLPVPLGKLRVRWVNIPVPLANLRVGWASFRVIFVKLRVSMTEVDQDSNKPDQILVVVQG